MLTAGDRRRRWWGTFFLVGALSMLIWGVTFLHGRLKDVTFVYYWLACISLAALAFFTAVIDLWIIRQRATMTRRELEKRFLEVMNQPDSEPRWPKMDEE